MPYTGRSRIWRECVWWSTDGKHTLAASLLTVPRSTRKTLPFFHLLPKFGSLPAPHNRQVAAGRPARQVLLGPDFFL